MYRFRVASLSVNRMNIGAKVAASRHDQRRVAIPAFPVRRSAWLHILSLTLRVHADAFRFDPAGYAEAVWWRARGLRVRSRNRFSKLMGRSPRAYALWIARREPGVRSALGDAPSSGVPITVVVDCTESRAGFEDTLHSLDAAGRESAVVVSTPADLRDLVDPNGSWLCVVRPGDLLAADALDIYRAAAAAGEDSCIIYADDDLIADGDRRAPHFKSSWNSDLFEHHDYISGSAIVRVIPDQVVNLEGDGWLETLVRRAVGRGSPPIHLPAVLHHRRHRAEPSMPPKPRQLLHGAKPLVSVIVPTRNAIGYVRTCIEGLRRTAYPALELIVVDNDSDDPAAIDYLGELGREGVNVLRVAGAFNFSALNNAAVRHARGELLCFLNNDIEMVDRDWLSLLVRQAMRPELGAVGGRLLYPDGTIQHAGVVTGIGGGAAHAHRMLRADEPGYFQRHRLPQKTTAVTAACLVVAKEKFLTVGGFDEHDFPVAFNDVDLCLKLNARGWQSFYEPRAVLIHHESKSRGSDTANENRVRFAAELAALKGRWRTDCERDPYHHPQLSPFSEQFFIAV